MSDTFRRANPGDPLQIPAQTFNAMIDAAQAHRMGQGRPAPPPVPTLRQSGIVLVRNDSGSDQDHLAMLGIDAPIITPTANEAQFAARPALSCSTALTIGTYTGRWVILAEPLAAGKVGRAFASGVCPAKIYVPNDGHSVDRPFVDVGIVVGSNHARPVAQHRGCARILWREGGYGEQWAVICMGVGQLAPRWAQIDTNEASGGEYNDWHEVKPDRYIGGDPTWSRVVGGLDGTDEGPIVEINGVENIPVFTVVQIFPSPYYYPESTDPTAAWFFKHDHSPDGSPGGPQMVDVRKADDSGSMTLLFDRYGHYIGTS